jgi:hypothetical protein
MQPLTARPRQAPLTTTTTTIIAASPKALRWLWRSGLACLQLHVPHVARWHQRTGQACRACCQQLLLDAANLREQHRRGTSGQDSAAAYKMSKTQSM